MMVCNAESVSNVFQSAILNILYSELYNGGNKLTCSASSSMTSSPIPELPMVVPEVFFNLAYYNITAFMFNTMVC